MTALNERHSPPPRPTFVAARPDHPDADPHAGIPMFSEPPPSSTTRVFLVCIPCQLALYLGDAPIRDGTPTRQLTVDGQPSWHQYLPTRAVWKLLAEHLGHHLTVTAEETDEYDHLAPANLYFVEPDSATRIDPDDIRMSEYVQGWPEKPALPNWSGLQVEAAQQAPSDGGFNRHGTTPATSWAATGTDTADGRR